MKNQRIFAVISVIIIVIFALSISFIGCEKNEKDHESCSQKSRSSFDNGSQNGSSGGGLKDGGIFETH